MLTEEEREIRDQVRNFCQQTLAPIVQECYREESTAFDFSPPSQSQSSTLL